MSTRTTSARPASAMRCAVVAPTLPAPMTVTLLRAMKPASPFGSSGRPILTSVDGRSGHPLMVPGHGSGRFSTHSPPFWSHSMDRTPALALLGLLLVLLAIPLALSFGPLIIGAILLVWAARKAHLSLAPTEPGGQLAPGPAAAIAALTPSA